MKDYAKKAAAVLLAGTMLLGTMSACTQDTPTGSGSPAPTGSGAQPTGEYPITPEELGSGEVKWSEEETDDGWMKVTNEGGETLGYSPDSGVSLIQVDGYAFKDLNKNGQLDAYEDWRLDDTTRATELANMLSGEEIAPLMTHGGWSSFGSKIEGSDLEYIEAGGRAGTTRSAAMEGNTAMAADWTNALQALCEATGDYGIPATISTDPMLKNSDNTIHEYDASAEKPTVYIPYVYQQSGSKRLGYTWSCKPSVDLELASQYYNVVTDTVGEPSGTDEDGEPMYLASDIIRASAEEIAACDYAIVSMKAPFVQSTYDEETGQWLPASIQYEQYTADSDSVRKESIAGDMITQEIDTGDYGIVTQEVKENRSYYGNTAALPNEYSDYETLQYVDSVVSEDCKVIVVMSAKGPMVWSEVEPMADAILLWFNGYEGAVFDPDWFQPEAIMNVITGQVEPSALLPFQQPASMEAVEAQNEDVPRDVECYVDSDGNAYDFAFGMNWSGVISDERTETYSAEPLTTTAAELVK